MKAPWEKIWPEWQCEARIGQGSSGIVYRALKQTEDGSEKAAIKVISIPPKGEDWSFFLWEGFSEEEKKAYCLAASEEMLSEVRLVMSLGDNPHVVRIQNYAREETGEGVSIFIRMELLRPINALFSGCSVPEEEILRLGIDVCDALEQCHSHQVLHRDIKPENIFVGESGHFKLGDFGVARSLENASTMLTRVGTPLYMAPEVYQSFKTKYDQTSDLYSLGLVLYHYANHQRLPFADEEIPVTASGRRKAIERRLGGESLPPPSGVSDSLAQIILRACSPLPKERYSSAEKMKMALISIAKGQKKRNRKILWIGASLGILLLGAAVAVLAGITGIIERRNANHTLPVVSMASYPVTSEGERRKPDLTAESENRTAENIETEPYTSTRQPSSQQEETEELLLETESSSAAEKEASKATTVFYHAHSWTDIAGSDTASCTAGGHKSQECSICGQKRNVKSLPLGHEYMANVCIYCGRDAHSFILNPDRQSYSLLDTYPFDRTVIVQESYKGLPVTGLYLRSHRRSFSYSYSFPNSTPTIHLPDSLRECPPVLSSMSPRYSREEIVYAGTVEQWRRITAPYQDDWVWYMKEDKRIIFVECSDGMLYLSAAGWEPR